MMSSKSQPTGQPPVIFLTGGGSGGHITPILSLAHELKRQRPDYKLVYVGLRGQKINVDGQLFDGVEYITAGKLRRFSGRSWWQSLLDIKSIVLNVRDGFKLLAGLFQARRLVKRLKPNLVFSKGGYVAVPVAMAAHRQKVPIITHDSDAVPGLANRIVGRWAKWHAVGLETGKYDYPKDTICYTGIPLNPAIRPVGESLKQEYRHELGYKSDDLILLVGGAGLGSETLNDLTVSAAPQLLAKFERSQIVHITGADHLDSVEAAYQKLPKEQADRVKCMSFTDKFYKYSGAADLIVSRAGATAVAEFAVQGKACVLIPAPWLPGGQQTANAEVLSKAGAADVADNDISVSEYTSLVSKLLSDQSKRQTLGQKLHKLAKSDGASQLAKLIIETVEAS